MAQLFGWLEHLAHISKKYGLRKMLFGFYAFSLLCLLAARKDIPSDTFTTLCVTVLAGVYAGNVMEHQAKKDKPEVG